MTEKVRQKLLTTLQEQVINLLNDLLNVRKDPDILLLRLFFQNQIDPEELMDGFETWVYDWKDYIKARNEKFFKENDNIFGPLPKEKLEKFKEMFDNGTFDESDKEIIWQYFDVYISLINQYKKLK